METVNYINIGRSAFSYDPYFTLQIGDKNITFMLELSDDHDKVFRISKEQLIALKGFIDENTNEK